jgi:serine/threonine-protein kinase
MSRPLHDDDEARGAPSVLAALAEGGSLVPRVKLRDFDGTDPPSIAPISRKPGAPRERYEVLGEIAKGGVGVVLKAHDLDLGRDLAMKVLREEHAADPEVTQRFVEEAQIGGQLQHPGIVPVYELGRRGDKRPYFTMKLVKGRTLGALLRERKDASRDRRRFLAVFESVCQTLAYAHARGVIHRDVKPSNVMVGAFGEVQVVDWGLGKVLSQGGVADERRAKRKDKGLTTIATVRSGTAGSESRVGSVMGTPAYMPPEQAMGDVERTDERSDVFGLGAVLCEILTDQPPYIGTDIEIIRAARKAELDPAKARLAACGADAALVALCEACLAPAPQARPRDASAVAKEVSAYLLSVEKRELDAKASAEEARETALQAQRARRLTIGVAAAALVAVAVGAGALLTVRSDRLDHEATAQAALETALREATLRRGEAEGGGNLAAWSAAVETAKRADALAREGDVPEGSAADAAKLLAETTSAAQAAQRTAEETERERRLEERLVEIRGMDQDVGVVVAARASSSSSAAGSSSGSSDFGGDMAAAPPESPAAGASAGGSRGGADAVGMDAAYAQAFREFGLDVETLAQDEAARRIRATGVASSIGRALASWSDQRRRFGGSWERLHDLAYAVVDDPWWKGMREATTAERLREFARPADVAQRDVLDAVSLTGQMMKAKDWADALPICEDLRRRAPGSQCALCHLATVYDSMGATRSEDSVRAMFAGVATDPRGGQSWKTLAAELRKSGETDAGADAERRAVVALRRTVHEAPASDRARVSLAAALYWLPEGLDDARVEALEAVHLAPTRAVNQEELGVVLGSKGDRAGAESAFRAAALAEPARGLPHLALSDARMDAGDVDGAVAEARKACEVDPSCFEIAHERIEKCLEKKGDVAGALVECDSLAKARPSPFASSNRAWLLGRQGDLKGAVSARRDALRLDTDQATRHIDLGNALLSAGDADAALAEYREAVFLDPRSNWAHRAFSWGCRAKGDMGRALAEARVAVSLDRTDPWALGWLACVLAQRGEKEAALEAARQAVRAKSDCAYAHFALACCLPRDERSKAADEFRETLRLDPEFANARQNLAVALAARGSLDAAATEYSALLTAHPNDAQLHREFARFLGRYQTRERDEESRAHLRDAVRLNPHDSVAWFLLLTSLDGTKDDAGAAEAARHVIALGLESGASRPGTSEPLAGLKAWYEFARTDRAIKLAAAGELYDALAEAKAFVRQAPESAEAHFAIGSVLLQTEDVASALTDLREAVQREPTNSWYRIKLALALEDVFAFREAEVEAREAVRLCLQPATGSVDRREAADALCILAVTLGDRDKSFVEAEATYRRAVEFDSANGLAQSELSWALRWNGKLAEALAAQRRYLEMNAGKWKDAKEEAGERWWEAIVAKAVELQPHLADILRGTRKPASAQETLEFGYLCDFTSHHAAAVDFYQRAFAADPALAETGSSEDDGWNRREAACTAAFAAGGAGEDAPSDAGAKARLRARALDWLKTELAAVHRSLDADPKGALKSVRSRLDWLKREGWLEDVRAPEEIAKFPPAEQAAWRAFWSDVDALIARVGTTYAPRDPDATAK